MTRRVMVVDDSAMLRELLSNSLASFGYEVVGQAKNGFEAVKVFRETRPEAVLLDIKMPDFDGWYALERILAIDPDMVVIMLTAEEEDEVREKCSEKGAKGFLHKPFVMDRLHEEIRMLLGVARIAKNNGEVSDEYYQYWVKPKVSFPHKVNGDE